MIGLIGRLSERVSRLTTAARLAWLNGVLAIAVAVGLLVEVARQQPGGLLAVLIAAAVCTLSANAALILALVGRGTPSGVVGALAGSLVGMMLPLLVGMVLQRQSSLLAHAGVLYWILAFYLAALVVKTLLVAPAVSSGGSLAARTPTEAGA